MTLSSSPVGARLSAGSPAAFEVLDACHRQTIVMLERLSALVEGVEIFVALSHEHVALEESCIYPQARVRFDSAALQRMGREMAERRRARSAKKASGGGNSS